MTYFNTERSTNYRYIFFKNNKPLFWDIYFCAYCGMPHRRKKITVDHLYPINRAKYSKRLRKKLQRRHFKDINDVRNLVPACRSCNSYKSAKLGIKWIIMGQIGRIQWLWIPRHILRICLLTGIIIAFTRILGIIGG